MIRERNSGIGDATMRASLICVVLCAVGFCLVSLVVVGPRAALGVAAGGTIASVNLYVLARLGRVVAVGSRHAAPWMIAATLKTVVLFAVVGLLLRWGLGGWLAAFAAGYSSLVAGIALATLFGYGTPALENDDRTGPGILKTDGSTAGMSPKDTNPDGR